MKRKAFPNPKLIIIVSLVAALAIVVPLIVGCLPGKPAAAPPAAPPPAAAPAAPEAPEAPPEVAPKVLKFATISPLSGPAAPWGVTILYGLQLWVERINEKGGIEIGGETYMLEALAYDDQGYTPAEALKGVKKGILEDGVRYFHSTSTSAHVMATAPFVQENDALLLTHGAGFGIRPEWPNVIGAYTFWPQDDTYPILATAAAYPEIETTAIITIDVSYTPDDLTWIKAASKSVGWDIVYEEVYPDNTVDFYPLMTSILATEPDVINLGLSYAGVVPGILATARELGYEGRWIAYSFLMDKVTEKVPAEYVEGAFGSTPDLDNPDVVGIEVADFFNEWTARWPGEWVSQSISGPNTFAVVLEGMKLADSVDPIKVRDALYAAEQIEHPYLGTGYWGGAELFGVDHWLITPGYVGQVVDGKFTAVDRLDFYSWWQANKDLVAAEAAAQGFDLP